MKSKPILMKRLKCINALFGNLKNRKIINRILSLYNIKLHILHYFTIDELFVSMKASTNKKTY